MDRRHAEANSTFIIRPGAAQREHRAPYLYYKTPINPCFHYHKSNAIRSCASAGRVPSIHTEEYTRARRQARAPLIARGSSALRGKCARAYHLEGSVSDGGTHDDGWFPREAWIRALRDSEVFVRECTERILHYFI